MVYDSVAIPAGSELERAALLAAGYGLVPKQKPGRPMIYFRKPLPDVAWREPVARETGE